VTIDELETQLQQNPLFCNTLQSLIPQAQGFRPCVTLYGRERKKKKNASAESWSPESGEIRIAFERDDAASTSIGSPPNATPSEPPATEVDSGSAEKLPARDPLSDLIRALDRTESRSRPGFDFVALKWFRDVVLSAAGFAWAQSDSVRQSVLRQAIEKRLILTGKIPNPKSPQFPVTSIRLNRLLPEVQAILGASPQGGEAFDPIEIRGEGLSATVLHDRR